MDNVTAKRTRRDWLKRMAFGAGGIAAGALALAGCGGDEDLPACTVGPLDNYLTVIVHGMTVIHVREKSIMVYLPCIKGHTPLAGMLPDLTPLAPGKQYSFYGPNVTPPARPANPYIFDTEHQVLIDMKATKIAFHPEYDTKIISIEIPRAWWYKPFRSVHMDFKGTSVKNYNLQPQEFSLGHVFQAPWTTAAILYDVTNPSTPGAAITVPTSGSTIANFHIYNEDPAGAHGPMLTVLDALFADPQNYNKPLDLDMADTPNIRPAALAGCDLQYEGLYALDELDLNELGYYKRTGKLPPKNTKSTGVVHPTTAVDPSTCLSYYYDECQPYSNG